jgi:hypothetical protein
MTTHSFIVDAMKGLEGSKTVFMNIMNKIARSHSYLASSIIIFRQDVIDNFIKYYHAFLNKFGKLPHVDKASNKADSQ